MQHLPERNPIYWLEFRRQWRNFRLHNPLHIIGLGALTFTFGGIAIFYSCYFFVIAVAGDWTIGDRPDISGFWGAVKIGELLVFAVLGTLFMVNAISRERERKTLDGLVTVFPPLQIIVEKALGFLTVPFVLYLACTLLYSLLACACQGVTAGQMLSDHVYILLTLLASGAIGLLASSHGKGVASAMVWGMVGATAMIYVTLLFSTPLTDPSESTDLSRVFLIAYVCIQCLLIIWAPISAMSMLRNQARGEEPTRRASRPSAPPPAWLPRRADYLPERQPLLWFEMRRRVRGSSGFLILAGYLTILGVVLALVSWGSIDVADPTAFPEIGRSLWTALILTQTVLILLLVPGLSVSAVMGERESGTIELLFTSPITTRSLLWGKLLGTTGQLLLLLFAALPITAAISMTYGGIAPLETFLAFATQTALGAYIAALGMLASCGARQYSGAVVRAYLFTIGGLTPFCCCFPMIRDLSSSQGIWMVFLNLIWMPVVMLVMTKRIHIHLDRLRCEGTDLEHERYEWYRKLPRDMAGVPPRVYPRLPSRFW